MRAGLRSARILTPVGCFSDIHNIHLAVLQRCGERSARNGLALGACELLARSAQPGRGARAESASDLLNFSLTFGGSE